MAKFLVQSGVDVNKAPVNGYTPLHSAAKNGHLEIVILLMNHGALMMKNSINETPALTAAAAGKQVVLEYIIFRAALSFQARTDALELLGANFVNRKIPDISAAITIWRQCFEDRKRYDLNFFKKKKTRSNLKYPWRAYETLQDIEHLLKRKNDEELRNHAVSVEHRILGPSHPVIIYSIGLTGAVYAAKKQYVKCLDFWMYVFTFRMSELDHSQSKVKAIVKDLKKFLEVLTEMLRGEDEITCAARASTIFKHCLTVLHYLTLQKLSHLSMAASAPVTSQKRSITENYNETLKIAVMFVSLFCRLKPFMTAEQEISRDILLYNFVVENHCLSNKSTVLHIACLKKTYDYGFFPFDEVPILKVVTLLLSFKKVKERTPLLSPRSVDNSGNTALHVIAKVIIDPTTSVEMKRQIVRAGEILVRHGGDVDQKNRAGESFRSLVHRQELMCEELVSLFDSATQAIPSALPLSNIRNDHRTSHGESSVSSAPTPVAEQVNPSLCVLCLEAKVDTLIIPCNHVCLCSADAERLKATAEGSDLLLCPVCRTKIRTFVKVFLS